MKTVDSLTHTPIILTPQLPQPRGFHMPTPCVNLDALIKREDFEIIDPKNIAHGQAGKTVAPFSIEQLREGQSLFEVLRKPDFQRETASWKPQQIVDLVRNFLDEELIPAMILWKASNGLVFVIDGAHRLSALIAWANDDYGDGELSKKFFGDEIPPEQKAVALKTKDLVKKSIGSYADLRELLKNPGSASAEKLKRARNTATVMIINQSVTTTDATGAERSFRRINQGGVPISEIELKIIHGRGTPEVLASRALLRAGGGHRFWSAFGEYEQDRIENLGRECYGILYEPHLSEGVRTLDLPMAGSGYSGQTLGVLFEFVHLANQLTRDPLRSRKQALETPKDDSRNDTDGKKTISYLEGVRSVSRLINSKEAGSLGLHPAVYSYSATGKFQPTAFLAQVELVQWLKSSKRFYEFTKHRRVFEEFLVDHKYFINQVVSAYGSMTKSLASMKLLYIEIYQAIAEGKNETEIKEILQQNQAFSGKLRSIPYEGSGAPFSPETKAAVKVKSALAAASRCGICQARIHHNGVTVDHVHRQQEGGVGRMDNGQLAHPYCNTGFKEKEANLAARQKA